MKISFSATFLTSLALGFLFVTGRSIIEGAVLNTGIDYQILGFEFTDYVFYGFLHCFHYLIIINGLISISYILYHCYKHRLELKIRVSYMSAKFLNWVNGMLLTINKKTYYEAKRKEYSESKEFNLLDELLKHASFSYFFLITTTLIIYSILLIWISKSNDSQRDTQSNVLEAITFIENSEKKYFLIMCGKDRCIYATKDFKNFFNSKDYKINTHVLENIDIKSAVDNEVDFKAYKLYETQTLNGKIITVQINMKAKSKTDKTQLDCLLHLISSSPKIMNNVKDETHYALKSQEMRSINNLLNKEDTKAYFIRYFLPEGQELKNLYYFSLQSNITKSGCLINQPINLSNTLK